jgi:hypothetical protein
MNMTVQEIKAALANNTFNVYMKVSPDGLSVYRVAGARIKNGVPQVKTISSRARRGYLWWPITSTMQIYTN